MTKVAMRWGVFAALLGGSHALAADVAAQTSPTAAPTPTSAASARCAALGPGAFPVANSQTCIRIGGYISAVGGFGPGPRGFVASPNPFAGAPPNDVGVGLGASADVTTDTDYGTILMHVDVSRLRPPPPPD